MLTRLIRTLRSSWRPSCSPACSPGRVRPDNVWFHRRDCTRRQWWRGPRRGGHRHSRSHQQRISGVSNELGNYSFTTLIPGAYRVHAEIRGFRPVDIRRHRAAGQPDHPARCGDAGRGRKREGRSCGHACHPGDGDVGCRPGDRQPRDRGTPARTAASTCNSRH